MASAQFPSIVREMHFDLLWKFPSMLYGLMQSFYLNLYNEKIKNLLWQWMPQFEAYIPSLHINRLFMAMTFMYINKFIPDKRLDKQIKILLFSIDFELLETEIDPNHFSLRYGWPGVAWILHQAYKTFPSDYPNFQSISSMSIRITSKYKNKFRNSENLLPSPKQFGLSEGVAGIGLMEILWPQISKG